MRRSMTSDRKKFFKKYSMSILKRKTVQIQAYCWITLYLLEKMKTFLFYSKVKRLVMSTRTQNLGYLAKKNKKYVDEFNDYMNKAIKEYEKTPTAVVEERLGGDRFAEGIENPEFIDIIVDDFIVEIQTKIDNIIDENDLKEFIDNRQDSRWTLFERDDLREFKGLVYFENIYPNLSENEKKELMRGKIEGLDKNYGEKRLQMNQMKLKNKFIKIFLKLLNFKQIK